MFRSRRSSRTLENDANAEAKANALDQKIKDFREIGQTFNYLGKLCIVTGYDKNISLIDDLISAKCCSVKFSYIDDHGIIRHCAMFGEELDAVLRHNRDLQG